MGPCPDEQGVGKGKAKVNLGKRSSADAFFMESEAVKLCTPKVPRRDPDAMVAKYIGDNFKGWSQNDIHGHPDQETGMSLWETVADRKRKHKEEPKLYPMGSRWYREARQKFMPESFPASKLKATNTNEAIDEELLKGMMHYKSSASRAKIDAFIMHAASLNQREVVGIYTYFLELKPSASSDQLKCALNVLRMVARLNLEELFKEETAIIKQHMDTVMSQAHITLKSSAVTPAQFANMHGEILKLILPMEPLLKVLAITDGLFKPVKEELALVVSSSSIGKRLLGFLCKQTLAEEASIVIEKMIKKFLKAKGKKTLEGWSLCRKDIVEKVCQEPLVYS